MDEPDTENLGPSYSGLLDRELLALTQESDSLTDGARKALTAELRQRGWGEEQIAAFRHERERNQTREARWRKVRSLRLKEEISFLLIWPGTIFIGFVLLGAALFYVLQHAFNLNQDDAKTYAAIAWIGASALWVVTAFVIVLSGRADAWIRRWPVAGLAGKDQSSWVHLRHCAARSISTGGVIFLMSLGMSFACWRELGKPFTAEHEPLWVILAIICITGALAHQFVSEKCIYERLWTAPFIAVFVVWLVKALFPHWAASAIGGIREFSLLVWLAESLIGLTFIKSALRAGPAGNENAERAEN